MEIQLQSSSWTTELTELTVGFVKLVAALLASLLLLLLIRCCAAASVASHTVCTYLCAYILHVEMCLWCNTHSRVILKLFQRGHLAAPLMKAMKAGTLPQCSTSRCRRRVPTKRAKLCLLCRHKKAVVSGGRSVGNAEGNPGNAGNAAGNPNNAGNADAKGQLQVKRVPSCASLSNGGSLSLEPCRVRRVASRFRPWSVQGDAVASTTQ